MKLRPFNPMRLSEGMLFIGAGGLLSDPLARWFSGGIAGKTITMFGDSTTQLAGSMWDLINSQLAVPLGDLEGVTVINKGSNGQTMQGAVNGEMGALYATNPDLIILCFGINDVRQGGVNAAELASRITDAVHGIQTNLPNCDLILWTPNAMSSTDPTGLYIVPLASAQAYTDIMRGAFDSLEGVFSHTLSVDKMDATGSTCVALPSTYMDDALHPNEAGQFANLKALLPSIVPEPTEINLAASAAAWEAHGAMPWDVYPRALEDTRYCTLIRKILCGTYLDLSGTLLMYLGATSLDEDRILDPTTFLEGDIIETSNGVYLKNNGDWTVYNGSSVQVYNIPTASFPVITAPAVMNHYRSVDPVWTLIGGEGTTFTLDEPTMVRFGADSRWFEGLLEPGDYTCNTSVAGGADPAPFAPKTCLLRGV